MGIIKSEHQAAKKSFTMIIGTTVEKKARTNEYAIAWGTRIDAHTGLRGGGIRTMPDPAYPATMGKSPTASLIPLPLCALTPADPSPRPMPSPW